MIAVLAGLGEAAEDLPEEEADAFCRSTCETEWYSPAAMDRTLRILDGAEEAPAGSGAFKRLLRSAKIGFQTHSYLVRPLKKLAQMSLSGFQQKRLVFSGSVREGDLPVFDRSSVRLPDVGKNPYLLAECYSPVTSDWKKIDVELESIVRRDPKIGLFNVDAGVFPDQDYVELPDDAYCLSPIGPERTRALILDHLESVAEHNNDCFSPLSRILPAIEQYPLFYRKKLKVPVDSLSQPSFLGHFAERLTILPHGVETFFYLREIREAEEFVQKMLLRLMARPDHTVDLDWIDDWNEGQSQELRERITGFDSDNFLEERKHFFHTVLRRSLVVVTGRPGSGKTHVVAKALRHLLENGKPVTAVAPTGKAVLRLAEYARINARTIDSLFHQAGLDVGVAGAPTVPAGSLTRLGDIRNLVIDESSMVDLGSLCTLLRILHAQGLDKLDRLILIGDQNQLPPIGLGRPFHDIVDWVRHDQTRRTKHFVHLEVNCRQESDPYLLEVAALFEGTNRYHSDLVERLAATGEISPALSVECWSDEEELAEKLDARLSALIEAESGISAGEKSEGLNVLLGLTRDGRIKGNEPRSVECDRFQILTPYRVRFGHAAAAINQLIHERYKAPRWPTTSSFSHSEKIIRLSNWYGGSPRRLVLANGSIGIVCEGTSATHKLGYFPSPPEKLKISAQQEEEFTLAYAITVHKAQGSDFDHVFVVLPSHWPLLTRELIYTAMTRSRKRMTLFVETTGGVSPIESGRRRSAVLARNTSLFGEPLDRATLLEPEPGQRVDSKIEYILYTALMQARDDGRILFEHHKKTELDLPGGRSVTICPDFALITEDNEHYYLEHLGMLDLRRYSAKWQKKKQWYSEAGLSDRLVTTDDLNGIVVERVHELIGDFCQGTLQSTPASPFSSHHYELWKTDA